METKQKIYSHTVLCRLQYDNGYLYEGEIMEERVTKGLPPQPIVYAKWPDQRINGYGKLIQPNGKVILGRWVNGKPNPRITIHKNGKREYYVPRFLLWDANRVNYTEDRQFLPGGVGKNSRNEWNKDVLDDICAIEDSIALQQQVLKDAPIYRACIGDSKVATDRTAAVSAPTPKKTTPSKSKKATKLTPIGQALHKAKDILGTDAMGDGDRVCAILDDLVPKLEKERRRVKFAYASKAVAVLLEEPNTAIAQQEATKRLTDYTDMADHIAKNVITELLEALKDGGNIL